MTYCKFQITRYLCVLQLAYRSVRVCHFKKPVCLCWTQQSLHMLDIAETLHSGWQVNDSEIFKRQSTITAMWCGNNSQEIQHKTDGRKVTKSLFVREKCMQSKFTGEIAMNKWLTWNLWANKTILIKFRENASDEPTLLIYAVVKISNHQHLISLMQVLTFS